MVTAMRIRLPRLFLFCFAALNVIFPVGEQYPAAAQDAQTAADPILGAWKLNVPKSTNATAEAEILTIARQGEQFKLTFVAKQANEYNPHYEAVTDMKGMVSKPTDGGKPMNDAWRFVRNGPNKFEQEGVGAFGGWKKEYAVSSDGKTLTVHELQGSSKIVAGRRDANGVFHRLERILVFERIPEPEGERLIKEMVDADAAQKAIGAKKAAEQAALDAVACSKSSEQASAADQSGWSEYACPGDGFAIKLPHAPAKQSLQRVNEYNLFTNEDASIVTQLWVSAGPVDCDARTKEARALKASETVFQGSPAFESVDRHTNGPQYVLYDLTQCRGNRTYGFHARWLSDQAKPEEITRIFDSFRLLAKDTK